MESSTTTTTFTDSGVDQMLSCLPQVSGVSFCCLGCHCALVRIPPQLSSVTEIQPSVLAGRAVAENPAVASNGDGAAASSTATDLTSSAATTTSDAPSTPTDAPSQLSDSTSTNSVVSSSNLDDTSSSAEGSSIWSTISVTGGDISKSTVTIAQHSISSSSNTPSAALQSSTNRTPVPTMELGTQASMPKSSSIGNILALSTRAESSSISSSSLLGIATIQLPSPTARPASNAMSMGVKAAIGSGAGLAALLIVGFVAYMLFVGRKGKTETERTVELQDPPAQEEKAEMKAEAQVPSVAMMDADHQKEIGVYGRHGMFELA
ncbi:hypothetical protein BDZ45DRAFT_723484 [Acephala macrosclerotiorum]|nr:hypothetical protein BDZ45DRAFT_723484 [Acephala macrosclerotiorum]